MLTNHYVRGVTAGRKPPKRKICPRNHPDPIWSLSDNLADTGIFIFGRGPTERDSTGVRLHSLCLARQGLCISL